MELIIGGAYQGKLGYAAKKYGLEEGEVFDLENGFPEREYRCFRHLETLTKRASNEGLSAEETASRLIPFIKNAAVISREIGCGIVPMDPAERLYRELHGAVLRLLAEEADRVTRIFCGLGEVLK